MMRIATLLLLLLAVSHALNLSQLKDATKKKSSGVMKKAKIYGAKKAGGELEDVAESCKEESCDEEAEAEAPVETEGVSTATEVHYIDDERTPSPKESVATNVVTVDAEGADEEDAMTEEEEDALIAEELQDDERRMHSPEHEFNLVEEHISQLSMKLDNIAAKLDDLGSKLFETTQSSDPSDIVSQMMEGEGEGALFPGNGLL